MRNKKTIITLNILLAVYSLGGVCSKIAADTPFLSKKFVLLYLIILGTLAIYAVVWQQIINKISLTVAYANKAVSIVWGMLWGILLFREKISIWKIVGAVCVIWGVILYFRADEEMQE